MFHDGHRELQDRHDGRRVADALEKHRRLSEFGEKQREFIEGAAFFFLATVLGSVLSGGAYCLTSQGGDTRALHDSPVYRQLAEQGAPQPPAVGD